MAYIPLHAINGVSGHIHHLGTHGSRPPDGSYPMSWFGPSNPPWILRCSNSLFIPCYCPLSGQYLGRAAGTPFRPCFRGSKWVFLGSQMGPFWDPFWTCAGPSFWTYFQMAPKYHRGCKYLPFARIRGTGTYPSYDPREVHFGPSQGTWLGTPHIHDLRVCVVMSDCVQ